MYYFSYFIFTYIIYLQIYSVDLKSNPLYLFHVISSDGKNCSAIVVNERLLLTVASCIHEPITVYANGFNKYSVQYIKRHPKYLETDDDNKFLPYDLAMIKLETEISGIYKAMPVESMQQSIFGNYVDGCYVAYWFAESDSIHKEIKKVALKNLQFGRCEDATIKFEPFLRTAVEHLCDKFLFSYASCEADIKSLSHHSLPLICGGKLFGFLLNAVKLQHDVDMLYWSRASGYRDWIDSVFREDDDKKIIKIKIINDNDTRKRTFPFMLTTTVTPEDIKNGSEAENGTSAEESDEEIKETVEAINEGPVAENGTNVEETTEESLELTAKSLEKTKIDGPIQRRIGLDDYRESNAELSGKINETTTTKKELKDDEDEDLDEIILLTDEITDQPVDWPTIIQPNKSVIAEYLRKIPGHSQESLGKYLIGNPKGSNTSLWRRMSDLQAFPWQIIRQSKTLTGGQVARGEEIISLENISDIYMWYRTTTPARFTTYPPMVSWTTGTIFLFLSIVLFTFVMLSLICFTFC